MRDSHSITTLTMPGHDEDTIPTTWTEAEGLVVMGEPPTTAPVCSCRPGTWASNCNIHGWLKPGVQPV